MALPNSKAQNFKQQELQCTGVTVFPLRGDTTVVTQQTNRTTAVTIDSIIGQITTNNASLGAGLEAKFVVNNKYVTTKSVPLIVAASGQTADTSIPIVVAVTDGAFTIQLTNLNASTADTGAMVINFVILGGN